MGFSCYFTDCKFKYNFIFFLGKILQRSQNLVGKDPFYIILTLSGVVRLKKKRKIPNCEYREFLR